MAPLLPRRSKVPYRRGPLRCQFRIGKRKCKRLVHPDYEDRCWQHGKIVRTEYVLLNAPGWCVPAEVRADGSLERHPYYIDNCKLCDQPGPHPHNKGKIPWPKRRRKIHRKGSRKRKKTPNPTSRASGQS